MPNSEKFQKLREVIIQEAEDKYKRVSAHPRFLEDMENNAHVKAICSDLDNDNPTKQQILEEVVKVGVENNDLIAFYEHMFDELEEFSPAMIQMSGDLFKDALPEICSCFSNAHFVRLMISRILDEVNARE